MNNDEEILTISKEEIAQLDPVEYSGRIVVIQTADEVIKAVNYLRTFTLLGFDTETRPSFRKGKNHKVSLIQISNDEVCFLFRINMTGFADELKYLLEDKNITKIGLSLRDDFGMLQKVSTFEPKGFIDLQHTVKQYHIKDLSLQKIFGILFRKKISKSQRLSNWESDVLSDAQKRYAAIDAWACLQIYKRLVSGEYKTLLEKN